MIQTLSVLRYRLGKAARGSEMGMDDASERSRARAARFHLFSTSVRVREDIPQMRPLYKAARDASRNKARLRLTKDAVKRANAIAAAQRVCGSGLAADTYLRQFLQEYNGASSRARAYICPARSTSCAR